MTGPPKTERLSVGRLLAEPGRAPALRNAEVTMADGRITGIAGSGIAGSAIVASNAAPHDGRIALPAFVNAHDHGYGILPLALGGCDDALECWIASFLRLPLDPRLEAAVAFGRMALAGIGATVHCHNSLAVDRLADEADGVARAAAEVGIRVAFSCPVRDRNPWIYGDQRSLLPYLDAAGRAALEAALAEAAPAHRQVEQVEEIAAAHESELFRVQYGPVGPQWCRDDTLARIAEASALHGRRVHMHLLESPRQRRWLDAAYPQGILRFLDEIGLLSPRLTVAHGVHLTEDECALLAERGVTVSVNTSSNLRMRSGTAPVARYLHHGLRFGFGLDGAGHDDDQDWLRDLRLARRVHNGAGLEPALPPARLFDAALRDGFRAIDGSGDYGALEPGARADLVVLDYGAMTAGRLLGDPDEAPGEAPDEAPGETAGETPDEAPGEGPDETEVLLTWAHSGHVRDLVVAGRPVVTAGRLAALDLPGLERELTAQARHAAAADPARSAHGRQRREAVRAYYANTGAETGAETGPSG
ncbi:MAG: amidohydrolase family protein [Rhodospirillaceae bacterium]|nr:amidohydrolase family protein [Rhodospirillaceae bacterium]